MRAAAVLALALSLKGCSGDNANGGSQTTFEDPRNVEEICETWCLNAEANGCPTISGSNCRESCEFLPANGSENCLRVFKNHLGCLADVPNVCDADLRDELCLDAYCSMRHACELPDPRCR